jgi:DNA-binding response OmpR family regulator
MTLDKKHIVVIDDTASIRTFLRISLEGEGALFSEAETAEQGLDLCERTKPDLVVLDLGLPDRDGLDILPELIQRSTNGHTPPVIVLTVRKDLSVKEAALKRGASAYMTKPFLMDDLLDVISEKIDHT